MSSIAQNLLEKYYGLSRSCSVDESTLSNERCVDDARISNRKSNSEELSANVTTFCDGTYETTEKKSTSNVLQHCDNGNSDDESCQYSFRAIGTAEVLENDETSSKGDLAENTFENENEKVDEIFVGDNNDLKNDNETNHDVEIITADDEAVVQIEGKVNCKIFESVTSLSLTTKPQEEHTGKRFISLPATPDKSPVYDPTFIDLTNAGIRTLTIGTLLPFLEIRMLYLENNSLTELPDELFPSLRRLEWLDVRNNELKRLPSNIKSHPELRTLLLQRNKFEILPIEIGQIEKLRTLQVSGNPLIMPPKDVVARGSSAILHFLRTQCNELSPQGSTAPVKKVQRRSLTIVSPSVETLRNSERTSKFSVTHSQHSFKEREKIHDRCNGKTVGIGTKEECFFWLRHLTKWLDEQMSIIQRMKDDAVRREWRLDKRSFAKSMEKAAKRQGQGDVPFALDVVNYPCEFPIIDRRKSASQKRDGKIFTPPTDINAKVSQLFECLDAMQERNETCNMTPAAKRQFLSDQIEKIRLLRDEILYLQRYNDVVPLCRSHFERV